MQIPERGVGGLVSHPGQSPVSGYTRPSVVADIMPVATGMRAEDKAEVAAGCGQKPEEALLFCFFQSNPCMTIVGRNRSPIGMWGAVDQGGKVGRVWLLATNELVDDKPISIQFLRQAKPWLQSMFDRYDVLFNYADARNVVHIKWLRWMGFTFIAEHSNYGAGGLPFLEFVKVNHV